MHPSSTNRALNRGSSSVAIASVRRLESIKKPTSCCRRPKCDWGVNPQVREPKGQCCSDSLVQSTAGAAKPTGLLASRRPLVAEPLRRATGRALVGGTLLS